MHWNFELELDAQSQQFLTDTTSLSRYLLVAGHLACDANTRSHGSSHGSSPYPHHLRLLGGGSSGHALCASPLIDSPSFAIGCRHYDWMHTAHDSLFTVSVGILGAFFLELLVLLAIAIPLMTAGCLLPLRPIKGWLVASQFVNKAIEAGTEKLWSQMHARQDAERASEDADS